MKKTKLLYRTFDGDLKKNLGHTQLSGHQLFLPYGGLGRRRGRDKKDPAAEL